MSDDHESPPDARRHSSALRRAGDVEQLEHLDTLPGQYPFVRGPYPTMYSGRPWTIRQYAGFSTAEESNAFYRRCLAGGQRGLSVAFDLATHRGYDSDHERVRGDVGMAGVAVDSVEDMRALFDGIPLGQTSVSMTMNGAVLPIFAAYVVAAEEQGVATGDLTGTIQNDILKEFMVRNTYIYPPEPSMRISTDVVEYAAARMPRYNPISVSGYHMHEAGAPADLELAYTLADGLEYVERAVRRGLDVDAFAARVSFFFAVGMDFLTEVAKLRAARLLWATLMKERFSPKQPQSMRLRMHCQTSGVSLTAQDPLNNVVRTTLEALAALFGGTQSLHTNAFDEALALPSDASARLARNTQLVLQFESGVTQAVDPFGGSYFMESRTYELAQQARKHIDEILAVGGMTTAVERGIPQRKIERAAAARQARLDQGTDVQVGVNRYRLEEEPAPDIRSIDNDSVRRHQIERLQHVRATRDESKVESALSVLGQAASGDENLVIPCIEAMRARATVGEVSLVLERVFGRHRAPPGGVVGVYSSHYRDDPRFQALVERVRAFREREGRQPRVLMAKLGQDGHDRGAKVVAAGLGDLGFDVDIGPLFQTPDEVARDAIDNDVHVVGVSSQAGAHRALLGELCQELVRRDAGEVLVVCGGVIPQADHEALRKVGVRAIFEPGTALLDIADELLGLLEARKQDGP